MSVFLRNILPHANLVFPLLIPLIEKSFLHVYELQGCIHLDELSDCQLGDNQTSIGLLVLQAQIQDGGRSYSICLGCTLFQS